MTFWKCRLRERLRDRMRARGVTALWIQGWQVAAYWQAVAEARAAGVPVWLRGESNDLAPVAAWKGPLRRLRLGWMFRRVDEFLCIGTANRRLYEGFGVPGTRLHAAPYAVDNDRFARQAEELRVSRAEIRRGWNIAPDARCVLFCGKFIAKKRPMDLIEAAGRPARSGEPDVHLLFVGSGELGGRLRGACDVAFDADAGKDNPHCAGKAAPARWPASPASSTRPRSRAPTSPPIAWCFPATTGRRGVWSRERGRREWPALRRERRLRLQRGPGADRRRPRLPNGRHRRPGDGATRGRSRRPRSGLPSASCSRRSAPSRRSRASTQRRRPRASTADARNASGSPS